MKVIIILIISLFLIGCENNYKEKPNDNTELRNIILENNYIIVDVRNEEEYNEGHLKNALNIPYNEINDKINLDKNKTILVYCKSGNRSSIADNKLTNLGYKVYDLGAYDNINLPKE